MVFPGLKPGINLARAPAFRRVAGDIVKITFGTAGRAAIWRRCGGDGESALTAFPESQPTRRAHISSKSAVGGITAVRACPFLVFRFHWFFPFASGKGVALWTFAHVSGACGRKLGEERREVI